MLLPFIFHKTFDKLLEICAGESELNFMQTSVSGAGRCALSHTAQKKKSVHSRRPTQWTALAGVGRCSTLLGTWFVRCVTRTGLSMVLRAQITTK